MKVVAPPEVAAFVRDRGSRLFVWHDVRRCCSGGVSYLATSLDGAPDRPDLRQVPTDGFELWFSGGNRLPPDELHLALKGWRRKRVEAYWNGCVFVV